MSSEHPRASIGLPVYNGMPYIAEAIESLLGQTFANFELLISDNASEDGTYEVCQHYAREDRRIRLFRNETNLGATFNYNRLFREAKAPYFKWAAADDVSLPEQLEKSVAVLDTREDVALCYPRVKVIKHVQGRVEVRHEDRPENLHVDDPSPGRRFAYVAANRSLATPIFGLIRSAALRKTPLFGSYPSHDRVLLAEIAVYGKFHEIPEVLFVKRRHAGDSMTAYKSARARAAWFDPENAQGHVFPECRLLWELSRASFRHLDSRADLLGAHRALLTRIHRYRSYWPLLHEIVTGVPMLLMRRRLTQPPPAPQPAAPRHLRRAA